MIGLVFPLLLLAGIVAAVVAIRKRSHHDGSPADHPPGEFRRAIELAVLAVLCIVATIGGAGLLTRLFDAIAGVPVDRDVAATARALAFTLIAGPIAAGMWWWRLRKPASGDVDSPVWAVFVHALSTLTLMVWSIGGLSTASQWIAGRLDRGGLAAAITWFAAWAWFRWLVRSSPRRPTRLVGVAAVLGSVVGLGLAAFGAVAALGRVGDRALEHWSELLSEGGSSGWRSALGWMVFALAGAAIWWLHWVRDGARRARGVFADVVFVLSGVVAGAVVTLVGGGMTSFDVLRWVAGADIDLASVEPALGTAIALVLVGSISWAHHQRLLGERPLATRRAAGLALSGIGLVGAATGLGIVVNSALGAVGTTLAGSGMRDLLCAGLSVFAVGLPLWVVAWRPGVQIRDPEQRHWAGRQIYLVIVFGVSALTALVTAILVAYQVFEFVLRSTAEHGLLERVRGSLGLLTATVIVAGYHFPVWRRDRTIREREIERTLRSVVLIVGSGTDESTIDELTHAVRERTRARLTVWSRSDAGPGAPTADELCVALDGVETPRALVIQGGDGSIEVVPLVG